jgi:hypothetical protein
LTGCKSGSSSASSTCDMQHQHDVVTAMQWACV